MDASLMVEGSLFVMTMAVVQVVGLGSLFLPLAHQVLLYLTMSCPGGLMSIARCAPAWMRPIGALARSLILPRLPACLIGSIRQ